MHGLIIPKAPGERAVPLIHAQGRIIYLNPKAPGVSLAAYIIDTYLTPAHHIASGWLQLAAAPAIDLGTLLQS